LEVTSILIRGTGRIRGAVVFGPPEAAKILREILEPFKKDGLAGVIESRNRRVAGSDHSSFNQAGLPGINLIQDPIEYSTHTWHTNLDTYERILEEDAKKAAVVVATAVYHLAMRDELLPRFTKEAMPSPPEPDTPQPPARDRSTMQLKARPGRPATQKKPIRSHVS
jgi:Zn-dependent M28 family amino/carboxypeptidase